MSDNYHLSISSLHFLISKDKWFKGRTYTHTTPFGYAIYYISIWSRCPFTEKKLHFTVGKNSKFRTRSAIMMLIALRTISEGNWDFWGSQMAIMVLGLTHGLRCGKIFHYTWKMFLLLKLENTWCSNFFSAFLYS